MKHFGDITKLSGYDLPVVDIITGGSPCQDLSVAGKRAGLAGERSGLFMEQVRIVKEMRERDARDTGRTGWAVRPRYMVWENVPGAFSSNSGKDFQAVLEEIVRIVEDEVPDLSTVVQGGGWTKSGCLYDEMGAWSVAWRVHDAQFWGVPQRRKRIALVADFGGLSAPEILFERKGLSWDSDESGAQRERPTAGAAGGADRAICIQGNCIDRSETAGCNGAGWRRGGSYTLNTVDRHAVAQFDEPILLESNQNNATINHDGVCTTLPASMGMGGGYIPMIVGAIGFKAGQGAKAGGIGAQAEVSPALMAAASGTNMTPCVVYDARGNGSGNIVPTITGDHESRVTDYTALCVAGEISPTLVASAYKGPGNTQDGLAVVVFDKEMYNCGERMTGEPQARIDTVAPTCRADTHPSGVMYAGIVRRLTPLECERLQGYPDGWTDIGEWTDSRGKKHKDADSPRYKALCNSIALPLWQWMARRICAQYERTATMASLFDGIGGFPLCFQRSGAVPVWASEIEEFPIAVTKIRFPEVGNGN